MTIKKNAKPTAKKATKIANALEEHASVLLHIASEAAPIA